MGVVETEVARDRGTERRLRDLQSPLFPNDCLAEVPQCGAPTRAETALLDEGGQILFVDPDPGGTEERNRLRGVRAGEVAAQPLDRLPV